MIQQSQMKDAMIRRVQELTAKMQRAPDWRDALELSKLTEQLRAANSIEAQKGAQANAAPVTQSLANNAHQAVSEADQHELMKRQALAMQAQMAGTGGISDMLRKPEAMAKGGAVAFKVGGDVGDIYEKLANGVPLTDEEQQTLATRPSAFAQTQKLSSQGYAPTQVVSKIAPTQPTVKSLEPPAITPIQRAAPYTKDIWQASGDYGVDPYVLMGVLDKESSFNPTAKNPKAGSTSAGMGGFTDATAKDYGITDRTDPTQNIRGTANYLSDLLNKVRDAHPNMSPDDQVALATTMYNQGPNANYNVLQQNIGYGKDVLNKATAFSQNKDSTNSSLQGMNYGNYTKAQPSGVVEQPIGIPSLQTTQAPQVADVYSNMEIAKGSTPEEERAAMEKYLGPNKGLESLQGEISKLKDEATADKEKAGWMSLLKAGLATMGGTSPYALTNIGAGAQAGVADFMDAQKEFRKERNRLIELQAKADDAARQEARSIYEHGEKSSQAKEAIRRSDLADQRRGKQETAYQNANLYLSNKAKDITAHGAQLEGAKLGLSDQMQEQQYLQAYDIVKDPNATPAQKEAAQNRIDAIKQMNMDKSPYAGLKQDQKLAFDYENAWQDYLSGKLYQDLPSGMTKEAFFNLLKGVPAAPAQQLKTSSGNPYVFRG